MSRVKGGVQANKRRKNILDEVKGYRFARSKKTRAAREAIFHANLHSFAHRKDKKNDFRRLWITRINAAARMNDISYSRLISAMKDKNMEINRKVLADLAVHDKNAFSEVVKVAIKN